MNVCINVCECVCVGVCMCVCAFLCLCVPFDVFGDQHTLWVSEGRLEGVGTSRLRGD